MLPVFAVIGGWLLLQKYEIDGLNGLRLKPRGADTAVATKGTLPPVRPGDTVRIASFNIQVFGEHKLADARTTDALVRIIRKFDVIAIQEIRAKDPNFMARFMQLVNAGGFQYDCVIGPRLGRTDSKEQYAYLFDLTRIEIDRTSIYTISDPDDLLHREPLVAGFRARGAPQQEAFTFALVDIHTDPDETDGELNALDDVFRAVRNDGRGEDDVILLGDLNVDESHLGQLGALPYINYVVSGVPTNTRGDHTYDNIVFDRRATTEYTGSAGVLDVMREFNLTLDQALLVSDHLPVWAEFSVYEGGRPGNVAVNPQAPVEVGR
ncbi:MAG: endonuclease/exonuclease/phosphatase family protein [Planctomycetia bacterium]|nr:endonuclease/exonuclease/phosphatase family protein [Planctomycetia bacterium]